MSRRRQNRGMGALTSSLFPQAVQPAVPSNTQSTLTNPITADQQQGPLVADSELKSTEFLATDSSTVDALTTTPDPGQADKRRAHRATHRRTPTFQVGAKLTELTNKFNARANEYVVVDHFCKHLGADPIQLVVCVIVVFFLLSLTGFGMAAISALFGFPYQVWSSYNAMKNIHATNGKPLDADLRWLIYWMCFGTFCSFEAILGQMLSWSMYYWLKIALLVFLTSSRFKGAELVYRHGLEPLFRTCEPKVNKAVAMIESLDVQSPWSKLDVMSANNNTAGSTNTRARQIEAPEEVTAS